MIIILICDLNQTQMQINRKKTVFGFFMISIISTRLNWT